MSVEDRGQAVASRPREAAYALIDLFVTEARCLAELDILASVVEGLAMPATTLLILASVVA